MYMHSSTKCVRIRMIRCEEVNRSRISLLSENDVIQVALITIESIHMIFVSRNSRGYIRKQIRMAASVLDGILKRGLNLLIDYVKL